MFSGRKKALAQHSLLLYLKHRNRRYLFFSFFFDVASIDFTPLFIAFNIVDIVSFDDHRLIDFLFFFTNNMPEKMNGNKLSESLGPAFSEPLPSKYRTHIIINNT